MRTYPPKSKWKLINTTIFPELENKTNEFLKDLLECKRSLKKIIKVSEKYKIKDFENIKELFNRFCIQKGCKKKIIVKVIAINTILLMNLQSVIAALIIKKKLMELNY